MSHTSYREESRKNYGVDNMENRLTHDQLQIGCLLRIADAVEVMGKSHERLQNEAAYLKSRLQGVSDHNKTLRRQVAAYKGIVAKAKKVKL